MTSEQRALLHDLYIENHASMLAYATVRTRNLHDAEDAVLRDVPYRVRVHGGRAGESKPDGLADADAEIRAAETAGREEKCAHFARQCRRAGGCRPRTRRRSCTRWNTLCCWGPRIINCRTSPYCKKPVPKNRQRSWASKMTIAANGWSGREPDFEGSLAAIYKKRRHVYALCQPARPHRVQPATLR